MLYGFTVYPTPQTWRTSQDGKPTRDLRFESVCVQNMRQVGKWKNEGTTSLTYKQSLRSQNRTPGKGCL